MDAVKRTEKAGGFWATSLCQSYNTYCFEQAALGGDLAEMRARWQWGVQTRPGKLSALKLGSPAYQLLTSLEMRSFLLEDRPFGLKVSLEKAVLSAARFVLRCAKHDLTKAQLQTVVDNLRALDAAMFEENPDHPYRPELLHATRLAKNLRDNAGLSYLSADDRALHQLALDALHYADAALPYSWNGKYRNCRPDPSVEGEAPTPYQRWKTLYKRMDERLSGVDLNSAQLSSYVKAVKQLGIGNCEEFAALALHFLRKHAPYAQALPGHITNGDHAFALLSNGNSSWVIDPWASKVYRFEERQARMKDYLGMQEFDRDAPMSLLAPITKRLEQDQSVQVWAPNILAEASSK